MKLARRSLLGATASLALANASYANQTFWPGALEMGTGQPGGTFTIFGPAWGRLITQATGVEIVYCSSSGSGSNLLFIEEGSAQLGICSLPVAIEAHNGTSSWTAGAKLEQFRVLFPAFPSVLQIVSTVDGVSSLAELQGRPVGMGPITTAAPLLLKQIFSSQGITPNLVTQGDYAQQVNELLHGKLAACAFFGAPPVPALRAVASANRMRLIGFSAAEAAKAASFVPGVTPAVLKAGTFPGQTVDVGSVGTLDLAVGSARLPDSLAEAATLAALQHRAQLSALIPSAAQPLPIETIKQAGLPFHPGAAKALHRLGYNIHHTR